MCERMRLSSFGVFKQMLYDLFSGMLVNGKVDEAFLRDHE